MYSYPIIPFQYNLIQTSFVSSLSSEWNWRIVLHQMPICKLELFISCFRIKVYTMWVAGTTKTKLDNLTLYSSSKL